MRFWGASFFLAACTPAVAPPASPAPVESSTGEAEAPITSDLPPFARACLGTERFRALGHRLAVSADGSLIAVGDRSHLTVFDREGRRLAQRTEADLPGSVYELRFTEDGRLLVRTHDDTTHVLALEPSTLSTVSE